MTLLNPCDYELKEAKRISEIINPRIMNPVFIIYINPKHISLQTNIFAIINYLLREKGVKVTTHEIYTESHKDLKAYLKIQNADVLFFPILMHSQFPKSGLLKFPQVLYKLGYSVITCCSNCTDLEELEIYKRLLCDIGYDVRIINEKPFEIVDLSDFPPPSKNALKFSNLSNIYKCNLNSVEIDLEIYKDIREIACNTQYDDLVSRNDGIYKVSNEREVGLSELLSLLSMMECCWEAEIVTKEAIEKGLIVYLYIENGYVRGFAAFEERIHNNKALEGKKLYVLAEIYTCPEFRRKGISSKLIDYAIDDLEIDTRFLPIIAPVMPSAQKIISERIGEDIVLVQGKKLEPFSKDKIKKIWGIF